MKSKTLWTAIMAAMCAAAAPADGLLPAETGLGWKDGWVESWKGDVPGLEVRDTTAKVRDGLVKVVRRWTWNGKAPLEKATLSVRYRVPGDSKALKPFMPGILMYGNPSNKGRTDGRVPVFAGEKGEFAIFEEHRLPMPFTLLENANGQDARFVAIHTLPSPIRGAVREDLWWSMGVEVADGGTDIVMLSGPIGYNRRRSVAKARQGAAMKYDETYITLRPGQVVEKTFWIQTGKATTDAFGFEQAMDVSLDLFKPYRTDCYEPLDAIVRAKRGYAMTRWMDGPAANGKAAVCGFNMYDCGGGMTDVYDRKFNRREVVLGWCGCGATCGYALPVLDVEKGDWEKAQRSLDFICDVFGGTIRQSDGLFCVRYVADTGKMSGGDPVSCGQALNSIVKAIRFAEKSGGRLNPSKWKAFVERACDAISSAILADGWQEPKSTNAGFLVAPLVAGSEIFGRKKYLAAAKKLAAVFERRYFGYEGVYWGGTLDARCEDKEGAYAAFQGYAALLRNAVKCNGQGEKKYARLARHAMNMMLTYTMIWDATYPPGRLSDHAFKSTGWTVVSAQNQHLDAFGVLTTPEIWRMGEYLKDDRLKRLAAVMYRSCFQLTDASGSLGEQIQHTNFGQRGDMSDVYRLRGGYAERWTVFWLTAHFLNAAAEFKEMGVSLD